MPIILKDYGRNQKERKEHIHQSELLITGKDGGKAKHDTCTGASKDASPGKGLNPQRHFFVTCPKFQVFERKKTV